LRRLAGFREGMHFQAGCIVRVGMPAAGSRFQVECENAVTKLAGRYRVVVREDATVVNASGQKRECGGAKEEKKPSDHVPESRIGTEAAMVMSCNGDRNSNLVESIAKQPQNPGYLYAALRRFRKTSIRNVVRVNA
jgi:hypothetical protein